jgi:glucosamine 6-phosphate synthetase-like amidotransferase/phosphosugar isomerase protein
MYQIEKDFVFESETDTETIPKLLKHLHDFHTNDKLTFRELVELVIRQLVCCINQFALCPDNQASILDKIFLLQN